MNPVPARPRWEEPCYDLLNRVMAKSFLKQDIHIHRTCVNIICFLSAMKSALYMFWQMAYKRFIEEIAGIYKQSNVDNFFPNSMLK